MTDAPTDSSVGRQASQPSAPDHISIAVDGTAASGKSTIGRKLARALGYHFLDTGVMYRAVTFAALDAGVDVHDPDALSTLARDLNVEVDLPAPQGSGEERVLLDGVDVTDQLRTSGVEDNVSLVSRVPGVREALVAKQRRIAGRHPIVMAGRDIGTVVLPGARLKVYLDASLEERANRRFQEFSRSGGRVTQYEVMEDIRRRDRFDSEREVSPLRPAEDAVVITTDGKEVDEVLREVVQLAEALR